MTTGFTAWKEGKKEPFLSLSPSPSVPILQSGSSGGCRKLDGGGRFLGSSGPCCSSTLLSYIHDISGIGGEGGGQPGDDFWLLEVSPPARRD